REFVAAGGKNPQLIGVLQPRRVEPAELAADDEALAFQRLPQRVGRAEEDPPRAVEARPEQELLVLELAGPAEAELVADRVAERIEPRRLLRGRRRLLLLRWDHLLRHLRDNELWGGLLWRGVLLGRRARLG